MLHVFQVPPLNLEGDPGADTETEIELNTPRLNNPVFQKLKKKYPRAFRRRSSTCSDTSSICSLSLPGTPRTQRHYGLPPQAHSNGDNHVNSSEATQNTSNSFTPSMEDLTVSSYTLLRNGAQNLDHSLTQAFNMYSKGHVQNRSLPLVVPHKSSQGEKHGMENDSGMSLKERLNRNKKNLRELLDEKYPFKNGSLIVFSHTASDVKSQQDEMPNLSLSKKISKYSANQLAFSASKPPKSNQNTSSKKPTNGNLSLRHTEHKRSVETSRQGRAVQKPSVVEELDQIQLHSKRFSSPDSAGSTHDSAVDLDSASLPSSPSPSHKHGPKQNTTKHTSPTSNTQTHYTLPPRPARYAPKLKSRRSTSVHNTATDQFALHNRGTTTILSLHATNFCENFFHNYLEKSK